MESIVEEEGRAVSRETVGRLLWARLEMLDAWNKVVGTELEGSGRM